MIVLKSDQLNVEFQTLGGALSSIKDKDDVEYLWQGDPTYWSGQAPVLFPICGSVRNDTVLYDKEDGSQKEVQPETDKDGNGFIDLTKYGTVVGWRMEMKDDFVLKSGQGIRFNTYTSFKDPEKTRYDENDATKNDSRIQVVSLIKHNQTLLKTKHQIGPLS